MPQPERVIVEVGGHRLQLSNLSKVLYPEAGFTKADVIGYYRDVAGALLPHLRDRPLTVTRHPNGVAAPAFFEKNAPRHTPDWIRTTRLPAPGSGKDRQTIDYLLIDDLPGLVWLANLAALELHTPQWRVGAGPDQLVLDLDPGPPATSVECARVALLLRERLTGPCVVKSSGNKGLQLYTRWPDTAGDSREFAQDLARAMEADHPDLVLSRMTKALRTGKVFLDWSQNSQSKTTVSVYSLRAGPVPTVSAPLSWGEVEAAREPADLLIGPEQAVARLARDGDLFAPLLERA